ncbi:MAG: GlxA family transcriptional regulator [Acidimicrobiia bacterium]|nr:GlxA family transcriptional regulator [Acidimicrobiia bacterium]
MRRVVIFTFPGGQSLDVTGPLEVFASTRGPGESEPYTVEVVAPVAGPVRMGSGIELVGEALAAVRGPVDTFVVAGGDRHGVGAVSADAAVLDEVRRVAAGARRVASVCSGAFVLAAAGLLDGRRATTHWSACDELARQYPDIQVESDPIYVRDGRISTSAGVTAGIDLALALVEEDCGHDAAMAVARRLVVFLKRPGGQAQFSAALEAQAADHHDLLDIQAWIVDHLGEDLSVARLASEAAMSPRHFARRFRADAGMTPARYVERARLEAVRRRLEESDLGVDAIARECGFGSSETMRRSFLRAFRVAPTEYRRRFSTNEFMEVAH